MTFGAGAKAKRERPSETGRSLTALTLQAVDYCVKESLSQPGIKISIGQKTGRRNDENSISIEAL